MQIDSGSDGHTPHLHAAGGTRPLGQKHRKIHRYTVYKALTVYKDTKVNEIQLRRVYLIQ